LSAERERRLSTAGLDSGVSLTKKIFAQNGPSLMVAPASCDLEIARRESFEPKSQRLDERQGASVLRLDVRFESMHTELRKRMPQHQFQSLSHQALSLMSQQGIEAEISTLERAAENLADVHDSGNRSAVVLANETRAEVVTLCAINVRPKRCRR